MSRRLVFLPSAEFDFAAAYDLIAADSPRAALAFIDDLRRRCEVLTDFPRVGRPVDDVVYRITFDRRAVVFYSFDDETVRVSALRYLGQAF
ncbi:MAG: type II toxin-antitoxin system RelE/ParE family toxin [Brevundimonas sp.]|uniref:type II toxin-antitoxin system RelE/ParE family toxin n=1 Tax=Brevundimonas sp. TaxID=1871086 RepID=UPI0011FC86ED|nr:type II toxin-antitoxin system RelE/ParE family toxin [Brevundimonas sp.]RZJ17956.1 MAG: type II toxin-antitoxin system RelE/ParE family toxin [Brevundimonas sp.]